MLRGYRHGIVIMSVLLQGLRTTLALNPFMLSTQRSDLARRVCAAGRQAIFFDGDAQSDRSSVDGSGERREMYVGARWSSFGIQVMSSRGTRRSSSPCWPRSNSEVEGRLSCREQGGVWLSRVRCRLGAGGKIDVLRAGARRSRCRE